MADEVVTFDPAAWALAFPAFALMPAQLATQYFNLSTLYLSNSPCSVVQNIPARTSMLWLLTAHLSQIFWLDQQGGGSGMVGRINSATQGSVTVSAEFPAADDASWFLQTPYGAAFWQASLPYRTARYVPAPPYAFPPINWSRPGWGAWGGFGRGW
jgi:hypothetical protein